MTFPNAMDCEVSTQGHIWQADFYINAELEMRIKPIRLEVEKLLGTTIEELEKHAGNIGPTAYEPMSMGDINRNLQAIRFKENSHWVLIVIVIVVGLVVVALVCVRIYLYWRKGDDQVCGRVSKTPSIEECKAIE